MCCNICMTLSTDFDFERAVITISSDTEISLRDEAISSSESSGRSTEALANKLVNFMSSDTSVVPYFIQTSGMAVDEKEEIVNKIKLFQIKVWKSLRVFLWKENFVHKCAI